MKQPIISVIMSVYNGLPYLKEAVESILKQTYKNFEFIIVDDASTDDSLKYLRSLKDMRIRLIKNTENLGLAKSLNKAINISNGEYIARMDADDVSLPRRFERQVTFLQKNPSIYLCGSWVNLINAKGQIIGEKKYPQEPQKVRNALSWYTAVIHPTFMGKKKFFQKMKGYRVNYDFAEDYDLLVRAKNKFEIANIGQKLLLWRLADSRRSRENMNKMDKVELRIKIESLKRDGLSLGGLLGLLKKISMTYLLPFPIKYKIATALKYV